MRRFVKNNSGDVGRIFVAFLSTAIISLFLIGCGSGGGGGAPAADTTPPTVSSTSPVNGDANAAVNSTISVTFSEAMNPATITNATFTVSTGGSNVAGTVTYSDKMATFTSSASLGYMTAYTVTVTTGVKDIAGNPMTANYTCNFTTGSAIRLAKTGQTKCYDSSGNEIACAGTGQDGAIQAGVGWPNPRFTDNGNETITDNLSGLLWTKNANAPGPLSCGPGTDKSWQEALNYIKCLNTNNYPGYNDWRLPNRREIRSLMDYSKYFPALPPAQPFNNIQVGYWSSSTINFGPGIAWSLYIGHDGNLSSSTKSLTLSAWPVRGGFLDKGPGSGGVGGR